MPIGTTTPRARVLPPLEKTPPAFVPGDSATLSTPPPLVVPLEVPVTEALPAVVAKAPAPAVPQMLSMEMGEVGAGLLSSNSPKGQIFSSSDGSPSNTLGWSGQAGPEVRLYQTHLPQIHGGLKFAEQIMPGFQARMDQLLHTPDPGLQGKLDAITNEQNAMFTSNGKLFSTPDHRLSPHQLKQKTELTARIDVLAKAYVTTEKELEARTAASRKQAEQLAGAFLGRLRKHGRSEDVRERVKIDSAASTQLQKDGIPQETVKNWVNEFHHQTGLPAPRRLNFTFTEDRPCYTRNNDTVNIGAKFSKRLTLHEVAHRVEYEYPEISVANKDWVRARCKSAGCSDEAVKLQKLAPKGEYKDTEVALEDHFVNPYVGKVYPDLASEVLSMGLEHFASPQELTKLYTRDPEHVFVTLGALQIMHSKDKW